MFTVTLTPELIASSVISVPPLARDANLAVQRDENRKLIRHIEEGGVRTLLYGGNANFYNIPLGEYDELLGFLAEAAGENTWVIPSAGPAYGTMLDQAAILRNHAFPPAMVLPPAFAFTPDGVEVGFRKFVEAYGRPAVLYVKNEGVIEPDQVKRLFDDGLVAWIKYAIVREDTSQDEYLRRLVDIVDPRFIVSGIGEQPAIIHLRDFGVGGFTSGCVCVAPGLSMDMLAAIKAGNIDQAESIRETFRPLEDLRNAISPIRVLHDAVSLAGIADTGPILPLLSNLSDEQRSEVKDAASALLATVRHV
ncbi:MAG: dihydrodipicolinate synthase family protein [Pirellulales bacterium]|nr:dihydrodipicolinate synthase family protein [Pirellulales bacterium]